MSKLHRTINLNSAMAIIIGGVIGSGVFMKPAFIAASVMHPVLFFTVWIVAGLITLCGSLSNAEVASMYPETGGQYIFFQKMYGDRFAFLYGWASFAVFNTAGNASIAYVFSQYVGYFVDLPELPDYMVNAVYIKLPFVGTFYLLKYFGLKCLTILVLLLLSWINVRSVAFGAGLQRFLTILKSIAIIGLIFGLWSSDRGSTSHFIATRTVEFASWEFITAYVACLSAVFWAYDGWNNITFIAGEIQEPQRNIPLSLGIGLTACMFIYVGFNTALLYIAPVDQIAKSSSVAADIATLAWGRIGGAIIALMVILSVFGTANANILSTARVTYAMGQDSVYFKKAGRIHPKYNSPANALWWNFLWSAILVLSGSFDMLTDMLIFVSWFFYGASALGLFVLRFKNADIIRPFKVPGYPIIPAIFVVFTFCFLVITIIKDVENYYQGHTTVINSVFGILITLSGFLLMKKEGDGE